MWCGTHSEHRRRGAGLMMMQWGLNKADAMGLDCFVEATEAGLGNKKRQLRWGREPVRQRYKSSRLL